MNQTHEGFGARVRFARKKRGEAQVPFAKRAGVGIMTLRRAEEGKFNPRLETARKIADALDVRVEWLLTGDEPMVWQTQTTFREQEKIRVPVCDSSMNEGEEHTNERYCPSCQGRGFTWDYDNYDGWYALCTHCDGSGHLVIVEPGP